LGNPADWLIRSKHNRNLPGGNKLWDEVLAGEAWGEIRFILPFRPGQKAREVRQHVWMKRVELSDSQGGRIQMTCLIAREVGAPEGVKPVEWRLVTNREAETFEAAVEFIDWYRARWEIGVSGEGHIIQSVKVRPRSKDSGLVAWEAPWRESKTVKPSDHVLVLEYSNVPGCNVQ
jgi:hypothetical protein